jgi:hypothetical protein
LELTAYHKLRTAVQMNAAPGRAPDLEPVSERLRRSLMATGLFEDVEVGQTDDVDHLIIAMCTFPAELTEHVAAAQLEQLWQDRLRYEFWEAHATMVTRNQVELQGATRSSVTGHYLTLHVVAQKSPIPAQRTASS